MEIPADEDVISCLYALGKKLGFSLAHVRAAIETSDNHQRLFSRWMQFGKEDIRYLAWASAGRGDYTDTFWKSMQDEGEPVDDVWLKRFAR